MKNKEMMVISGPAAATALETSERKQKKAYLSIPKGPPQVQK